MLALPGNVDKVITTLRRRFGRPDYIVQSLIEKAKVTPAVKEGDLLSLIDFANAVGNLVSTMELLKSDGHLTNPELRHQLLSKLPHSLQLRWGEHLSMSAEVSSNLREFAKWLADRADAASLIVSQKEVGKATRPEAKKASIGTTQCFNVRVDTKEVEQKLLELPLEQRREFALKRGICFNCLRPNHRVWQCRAKKACSKCTHKHHSVLHGTYEATRSQEQPASNPATGTTIGTFGCQTPVGGVQLMTAVAVVKGPERRARVRVFLDLGSQASFVSPALVAALNPVRVDSQLITVSGFGSAQKAEAKLLAQYALMLETDDGGEVAVNAWQQEPFSVNIAAVSAVVADRWASSGVTLADQAGPDVSPEILLLLGADIAASLLKERKVVDGATAWRTSLGWVLSGPQIADKRSEATEPPEEIVVAYAMARSSSLESQVERLFAIEELPITSEPTGPSFPLQRKDNMYEVGLLWKGDERPAENREQALALARRQVERLEKKERRAEYEDVLIKEYGQLDAIEDDPDPTETGYYLPHHAVIREDSTSTKVRVVFNASASSAGKPSLNDVIHPGPSLLPQLTALFLRFREFPAAVQADIRKAFFMIGVREEDRRFLRFLWPNENGVMNVWRLKKLPFGVNCSPTS